MFLFSYLFWKIWIVIPIFIFSFSKYTMLPSFWLIQKIIYFAIWNLKLKDNIMKLLIFQVNDPALGLDEEREKFCNCLDDLINEEKEYYS